MAADGTPGTKGNPRFLGSGAPATATDLNLISDWAASNAGPSVANALSLPSVGNWDGRIIHTLAEKSLYIFEAGGWRLFSRAATSFTPAWTGLTIGNGTQSWVYSVSAGRVFVSGWVVFGSTTLVTALSPRFTQPVAGAFSDRTSLGTAAFTDAGTGATDLGQSIYYAGYGNVVFSASLVSGGRVVSNPMSPTVPFSMDLGDILSAAYSYVAA